MRLFRILKKTNNNWKKTSNLSLVSNTYVFEIASDATKVDVKKAIIELYGVEVASVNVLHTREKFKYGKKKMNANKKKI